VDINWKQLVALRKQKLERAMHVVGQDRLAVRESEEALLRASNQRGEIQKEKATYWQTHLKSFENGTCTIGCLQQAGVWSDVLDARIKQAGNAVREITQQCAMLNEKLDASSQIMRKALAGVQKADEMLGREQRSVAHQVEQRQENDAEEASANAWTVH